MYSGKIAVPPGGGGLVLLSSKKLLFRNCCIIVICNHLEIKVIKIYSLINLKDMRYGASLQKQVERCTYLVNYLMIKYIGTTKVKMLQWPSKMLLLVVGEAPF
jgi:hypothetical protein